MTKRRILFVLSLLIGFCSGLEPITMGIFAGGAAAIGGMAKYSWCQFKECCETPWIRHNVTLFETSMDKHVFGQHLVKNVVSKALRSHLRARKPHKALVLSFHGWTGGGKNYVAKFVAESLFKEGMGSKYVHFFSGPIHFPNDSNHDIHALHVQDWIRTNVSECRQSLFIFDEVDKMHPKILNSIKPFIDYHELIDGVDFRQSVFVFLSNSGGKSIANRMTELWKQGVKREDIKLKDLEDVIGIEAFNVRGGLEKSELMVHHLIDIFVPFLPLERQHVRRCIQTDLRPQLDEIEVVCHEEETLIDKVLHDWKFIGENRRFSATGCKRVNQRVGTLVTDILNDVDDYKSLCYRKNTKDSS